VTLRPEVHTSYIEDDLGHGLGFVQSLKTLPEVPVHLKGALGELGREPQYSPNLPEGDKGVLRRQLVQLVIVVPSNNQIVFTKGWQLLLNPRIVPGGVVRGHEVPARLLVTSSAGFFTDLAVTELRYDPLAGISFALLTGWADVNYVREAETYPWHLYEGIAEDTQWRKYEVTWEQLTQSKPWNAIKHDIQQSVRMRSFFELLQDEGWRKATAGLLQLTPQWETGRTPYAVVRPGSSGIEWDPPAVARN